MTGESPKIPHLGPPSWPDRPPAEEITRTPIVADPAPPWWRCWMYDPAPPWFDMLEEPELHSVARAKLVYERARIEATITYIDALEAALNKRIAQDKRRG